MTYPNSHCKCFAVVFPFVLYCFLVQLRTIEWVRLNYLINDLCLINGFLFLGGKLLRTLNIREGETVGQGFWALDEFFKGNLLFLAETVPLGIYLRD